MCKMATKTGIKMPIYSILNRVPIKAVPKTPFELYKGWNSSLKHMHVWSCLFDVRIYNPQGFRKIGVARHTPHNVQ